MAKVKTSDLAWALDWVESYDPHMDDEDTSEDFARQARVVAFLRAELARRQFDAAVRKVVKDTGAPAGKVRKRLRAIVDHQAAEKAATPTEDR